MARQVKAHKIFFFLWELVHHPAPEDQDHPWPGEAGRGSLGESKRLGGSDGASSDLRVTPRGLTDASNNEDG